LDKGIGGIGSSLRIHSGEIDGFRDAISFRREDRAMHRHAWSNEATCFRHRGVSKNIPRDPKKRVIFLITQLRTSCKLP